MIGAWIDMSCLSGKARGLLHKQAHELVILNICGCIRQQVHETWSKLLFTHVIGLRKLILMIWEQKIFKIPVQSRTMFLAAFVTIWWSWSTTLSWSRHPRDHLNTLQKLLKIYEDYGLKISVRKSFLLTKELKWCGLVHSKDATKVVSWHLDGSEGTHIRLTAAELEKFFICAQWMSQAIPDFADLTKPLSVTQEEKN